MAPEARAARHPGAHAARACCRLRGGRACTAKLCVPHTKVKTHQKACASCSSSCRAFASPSWSRRLSTGGAGPSMTPARKEPRAASTAPCSRSARPPIVKNRAPSQIGTQCCTCVSLLPRDMRYSCSTARFIRIEMNYLPRQRPAVNTCRVLAPASTSRRRPSCACPPPPRLQNPSRCPTTSQTSQTP